MDPRGAPAPPDWRSPFVDSTGQVPSCRIPRPGIRPHTPDAIVEVHSDSWRAAPPGPILQLVDPARDLSHRCQVRGPALVVLWLGWGDDEKDRIGTPYTDCDTSPRTGACPRPFNVRLPDRDLQRRTTTCLVSWYMCAEGSVCFPQNCAARVRCPPGIKPPPAIHQEAPLGPL